MRLSSGKLSVGPPYFEAVFVPLMAPAIFLIGLGPLARWKQASLPELAVRLRWAFAVSLVTALLMPFVMGEWKPFVSFGLLLAFWVIASIVVSLIHRLRSSGKEGLVCEACRAITQLLRHACRAPGHSGVHYRRNAGGRL